MVIKVEVSTQGINTHFVVTDIEQARTQVLYRHSYCARDHKVGTSAVAGPVSALTTSWDQGPSGSCRPAEAAKQ